MYEEAARLYDVIHEGRGKDYEGEARRVTDEIRRRCPGARRLLDVACGSGGHLRWLRHELDAEGVDVSEEMLALAADKCPGVRLHTGDARTVDLGQRFDAVTCLFSSIGYLATLEDLDRGVANMAGHLVTGGVLVVEPWIHPEHWRDRSVHAEAFQTEGLAVARVVRGWREGGMSLLEMRYVVAAPDGITSVDEHHRMALYTVDEYVAAFEQAGLDVDHDPEGLIGRGLFIGAKR